MFRAVTLDPLLVTVAFQAWVTVWPFANVQVTVQALMAALPAVTLTSPWKPPGHCPVIAYVAVQPREPEDGLVERDGDGLVERDGDGEAEADCDALRDGDGELVEVPP